MMVRQGALIAAVFALSACEPIAGEPGFFRPVSEAVLLAADPAQNLETARLLEDGCYWYEHSGPVETTLLPLRTPDGRPICAEVRADAEPTEAEQEAES